MKHFHSHNKNIPTSIYILLYACLVANIIVIVIMSNYFIWQ